MVLFLSPPGTVAKFRIRRNISESERNSSESKREPCSISQQAPPGRGRLAERERVRGEDRRTWRQSPSPGSALRADSASPREVGCSRLRHQRCRSWEHPASGGERRKPRGLVDVRCARSGSGTSRRFGSTAEGRMRRGAPFLSPPGRGRVAKRPGEGQIVDQCARTLTRLRAARGLGLSPRGRGGRRAILRVR